jgi:hypothetical protein
MLPLVITVRGADGHQRRYAYAESPVSIGRSPFAELQLTEPFVSRWEGTVRFDEREVTYFGLGSTNPAFVDGREVGGVEEDIPLGPDAVLTLGELQLRFSREVVPEVDLRRKGKPKPVKDGGLVGAKTVFLENANVASLTSKRTDDVARTRLDLASMPTPRTAPLEETPSPSVTRAAAAPALPDSVRGGAQQVTSDVAAADVETVHDHELDELEPETTVLGSDAAIDALHARHRESGEALYGALARKLEAVPADARHALCARLEARYPQLADAPAYRALRERLGLPTAEPDSAVLHQWLREIGRDVLPEQVAIDTKLTLSRVLALLETLTQSLAEINDAQDSVRRRWLGRAPRRSVLRSDNGRAVLAYLLNPQADWSARLAELEQTIREAVTHELALFRAVLEGARMLLEPLSPAALAQSEGVALPDPDAGAPREGFWDRLRSGHGVETRLWQRLVGTHAALLSDQRYQRVFLGRTFARTYLAAMGQSEPPALP